MSNHWKTMTFSLIFLTSMTSLNANAFARAHVGEQKRPGQPCPTPSPTVSPTATPTVTPSPTMTATPTATPIPTATPVGPLSSIRVTATHTGSAGDRPISAIADCGAGYTAISGDIQCNGSAPNDFGVYAKMNCAADATNSTTCSTATTPTEFRLGTCDTSFSFIAITTTVSAVCVPNTTPTPSPSPTP